MGTHHGINLEQLHAMRARGDKIACLTVYDAAFTRVLEAAGVDMFIVGDSLGMVLQGHDTTLAVTLDDMIGFARALSGDTLLDAESKARMLPGQEERQRQSPLVRHQACLGCQS